MESGKEGPLWLDLVASGGHAGAQACMKEHGSWEHPWGTGVSQQARGCGPGGSLLPTGANLCGSLRGSERLMPLRDFYHPPFHQEGASRAGPLVGAGVPGLRREGQV